MGEWDVKSTRKATEWDVVDSRPISTVTDQPIPTDEQKIQMSNKVIREGAPIAGDIAATMAMPQLGLAKSAPMLTRLGTKGINLLGRMMASGAGSAGGELTGQAITGEDINLEDAQEQAMLGAGGELGISAMGAAAKPIFKGAAGLASKLTFSGRKTMNIYRDKLIKDTTEKAISFISDMEKPMSKEAAGKKVGETLQSMTDFDVVYKPVNDAIDEIAAKSHAVTKRQAGTITRNQISPTGEAIPGTPEPFMVTDKKSKTGQIYMDDARELLINRRNAIPNVKNADAANKKLVDGLNLRTKRAQQTMIDFIEDGYVHPEDAKFMISSFYKTSWDDSVKVQKFKEILKETMLADLTAQQGMKQEDLLFQNLRHKADEVFKASKDWFKKNPSGQRILEKTFTSGKTRPYFEDYAENVVDNMMTKYHVGDVKGIKKEMLKTEDGKKAWAAMEYQWVSNLYNQAIETSGMTGTKVLKPQKLADLINEHETFFKQVSPELWPRLQKEAKHYEAMAREFAARESRQTFSTAAGMALAASAGGFGNLAAIPAIEGFGLASAWALMSPTAKKVLKPVKKLRPVVKAAAKTGVHLMGKQLGGSNE